MIDINLIRTNPAEVKKNLKARQDKEKGAWVDTIKEKDGEWRTLKQDVDKLRASRNSISKEINEAKKAGEDVKNVLAKAKKIPSKIEKAEAKMGILRTEIDTLLLQIPNILAKDVPVGKTEEDNKEVRKHGKKPKFDFKLQNHAELAEKLNIADFDRAAKIAGSGFYFLKNELVLLEQALIRFTLEILNGKDYTLMTVPLMMRRKPYEGVTDVAAFEEVMYKIENDDAYMIATSEHPLVAQFMDEIIEEKQLPIKVAGISTCFRKEAGTHSVDEKGLFRVHQFNKVEQMIVCTPEQSEKLHQEMVKTTEEIFKALDLPYRLMLLSSADTGTVMAKTYDLEVWMPRQKQYREAVSASSATDYQSRRLNIRYRTNKGTQLAYTLNSTAIATSRALVAILENYQQKDGSVKIPKALWPYMNGIKVIKRK